ncbi:Peptidase-S8 domain-containing protein [Fusarium sp. LHS14.1]|nr:Peptidase-S8 domain-containing protein [Fusarium sp. LHS14.1]
MACNEDENSIVASKKLIPLMIERISNRHENESLALINSRGELTSQLRLALFELGNNQPLSQNNEPLSTFTQSLQKVLENFVNKDNDGLLKTEVPPRSLGPAPTQSSYNVARSPNSIRLLETEEQLEVILQQISSLRNPISSRPDVPLYPEVGHDRTNTHDRSTIQEGHDVNKVYESEKESEFHNFETPEAELLSNDRGPDYSKLNFAMEPQPETDEQRWGKEFMDQADKFYEEKIKPLKKRPIKVAVLDTGVKKEATHFRGIRRARGVMAVQTVGTENTSIIKAKSFIGADPDNTCDRDSHGTNVAALVVKIALHVDLYIAKVSEGVKEFDKGQFAEAIEWAIKEKVDIINISAALPDTVETRKAINEAEAKGIIVLAAASNRGANKSRVFPARMDTVLAIHATDGNGNSCGFNPSPLKRAMKFSTLGTAIPSPLGRGTFVPSGTSFSTPIAAGMAANILTLVENYFNESDNDGRTWYLAHKRTGMKAIFKGFSDSRNNYDYLCFGRLSDCVGDDEVKFWIAHALKDV